MDIDESTIKEVKIHSPKARIIGRWGKLLDELKVKENIKSDLALAETLDISRAFISAIRLNKRDMPMSLAENILIRLDRKLEMKEALMFVPLPIKRRTKIQFVPIQASEILLKRSNSRCELCGVQAPFESPEGIPYLEIFEFLTGEYLRTKSNQVALCPNCNQKMIKCRAESDINTLKTVIKNYKKQTKLEN